MSVILVIDEHSVYRNGLREVIEARVAHSRAIEASAFDRTACSDHLDLILIDSDCLAHSSANLLREMRASNPRTSFALMSVLRTRSDVLDCLSAGFHGFIYKLDSDDELVVAINDLLSGRMYVPRWIADRTTLPGTSAVQSDIPSLTRRQNDILPLLAQGMSNKEIAKHLSIAPGTAKVRTAALLCAVDACNRTEAAFVAAKIVLSHISTEKKYNGSIDHTTMTQLSELQKEEAPSLAIDGHNAAPAHFPAQSLEEGSTSKLVGAIPWLVPEDWSRWQQIDPALGDYDSWLACTSVAMAQAEGAGVTVEVVPLDPEPFLAWCAKTHHQTGSKGRSAYAAAELLRPQRPLRSSHFGDVRRPPTPA